MATKQYICDMRRDANDPDSYVSAIQAEKPTANLFVEDHFSVPSIPTGRVRVTVSNVTMDLHGDIMQIPGVSLYDAG